ncbi:hypothetical protein KUCAC02_004221 [Chaenocephalus aceratus]|uniref:Uncharacterized protein n=1 Tax=Chaenocephalus aceratus TaxID=36190 RepID=A0ACB9WZQ1_CHAAC|nr:hypothetical protein KUCAC02_004221 [Chaenocephalus aceratus]
MKLGILFGSHRSTVITLYNGSIGSSSALFLVIKLLHEAGKIPHPLPDGYTCGITCGKSKTLSLEQITAEGNNQPTTEEVKDVPDQEKSLSECLKSRLFWWHLLWLSVMLLRHYLYIGTLNPMLQRLTNGDPSLVSWYTNAFAITQLCGVLCAPWNGLIFDRNKGKPSTEGESEQEADLRASVLSLFLTALQCVLFSVCACIPSLPLQYFTFVLEVINRSFLFGGNAAFINVTFPLCHFAKLYGLVLALSSVFSLLQYACFALVNGPLHGDPFYVNIGVLLLILLAFIHPLSVFLHCRSLASQRAISASS